MHCDVIILAGGKGTRLQSVVMDRPKALALINGVPFLQLQLDWLAQHDGIGRVIISLGHQADQIREYCATLAGRYHFTIDCVTEATPLGTGGGAIAAARQATAEQLLVVNGDTYCEWPIAAMLALRDQHRDAPALIACRYLAHIDRYGRIDFDPTTQRVRRFVEKPAEPTDGWISVGAYLLDRAALLAEAHRGTCSMETDLLPHWIARGLYAVPCTTDRFIDIGTPESYAQAQVYLR